MLTIRKLYIVVFYVKRLDLAGFTRQKVLYNFFK